MLTKKDETTFDCIDVIMGLFLLFWEQSWVEGCGPSTIRQVATPGH